MSRNKFNGDTIEISNNILSLLYGKEQYGDVTKLSNFIKEHHPLDYKNKVRLILDKMQKENLILIRSNSGTLNNDAVNSDSIISLREQGKEVLASGGYKKRTEMTTPAGNLSIGAYKRVTYSSAVAIILSIIATVWYIIS